MWKKRKRVRHKKKNRVKAQVHRSSLQFFLPVRRCISCEVEAHGMLIFDRTATKQNRVCKSFTTPLTQRRGIHKDTDGFRKTDLSLPHKGAAWQRLEERQKGVYIYARLHIHTCVCVFVSIKAFGQINETKA